MATKSGSAPDVKRVKKAVYEQRMEELQLELVRRPIELPPRPAQANYKRPPKDEHQVIDGRFWEQHATSR